MRKAKDHPAAKALAERRADQKKANEEAMKRMDESHPTPTQEENDLAKLGVHDQELEDDGSGPHVVETKVAVPNQPLDERGYTTRDLKVEPKPGEQHKPK
jgi:hypothetical protein